MADFSFIGKGKIYIGPKDGSGALRELGNVSNLEFAMTEEVKELLEWQAAGGGKANELRRITAVEANFTLHDFIADNLALATRGVASSVASSSVTDEVVTAYKDGLARTNFQGISSVVVQDVTDTTTYVEDTDYEVRNAGIFIIASGAITNGEVLHIDYDYVAVEKMEALKIAATEYKVTFDGINEAQEGKAVVVDIHRLKFGPAAALALIGDDFAEMELVASCLADGTKTGSESQYFKLEYVE